jgi:hypothetical protein
MAGLGRMADLILGSGRASQTAASAYETATEKTNKFADAINKYADDLRKVEPAGKSASQTASDLTTTNNKLAAAAAEAAKGVNKQAEEVASLKQKQSDLTAAIHAGLDADGSWTKALIEVNKQLAEEAAKADAATGAIGKHTEANKAQSSSANDLLNAFQGLAEAQEKFSNVAAGTLTETTKLTIALRAQAAPLNALVSAHQNLATALAMEFSPLRAQTQELDAQATAVDALRAAQQGLANAKALQPYAKQIQEYKDATAAILGLSDATDKNADAARAASAADEQAAQAASDYGNSAAAASGTNPLEGTGTVTRDAGALAGLSGAVSTNTTALNKSTDKYTEAIQAMQTLASGLEGRIATDNAIIAAAAAMQKPTPPDVSAGATQSRAPGAYGGDQNASFFSDANSREQFLGQFGIKGNEQTQAAERAYALQLKQYTQMQAAAIQAQADADQARQQLAEVNWWLSVLTWWQSKAAAGDPNPAKFAQGGDFTVLGRPGTDANVVSFRATSGEKVSIRTPEQSRAAAASSVVVNFTIHTPDAAGLKSSRSAIVNQVSKAVAKAASIQGRSGR